MRFRMLICHGYVEAGDNEVALLVSHEGALPPMYAPGSSILSLPNRLSWRHLSGVAALCAIGSIGCLFDRASMAGRCRRTDGPFWSVAPEWNACSHRPEVGRNGTLCAAASERCPSQLFDKKMSLIDSLHQVCLEAQDEIPDWLAWSLSLEGQWK